MHVHHLDTYSHLDGPMQRLPAAVKLAWAMGVIIAALLTPRSHPMILAGLAGFVLLAAWISRVPLWFLFKRLLILEPVVIGVALLSLFQPHGLNVFAFIMARSTLCLFTMILLANTTPFQEILTILKRLRIPALIVTTLALMHRYLGVLIEESLRLRRARASRTFASTRQSAWRSLAGVAGQLFIRCGRRAECIYAAMCSRGWR